MGCVFKLLTQTNFTIPIKRQFTGQRANNNEMPTIPIVYKYKKKQIKIEILTENKIDVAVNSNILPTNTVM